MKAIFFTISNPFGQSFVVFFDNKKLVSISFALIEKVE